MEIASKIYLSLFDCILWEEKANRTKEYCHKGDVVGVRGRLQSRKVETEEGNRYYQDLIVEKITFITTKERHTDQKQEEE